MTSPQHRGGADSSPCQVCAVRSVAICAALQPADLGRLAEIAQSLKVEAGQVVFSEGEPGDALYTVTSGMVKLYKLLPDGRRQITGFLTEGDFLGLAFAEITACTAEAVQASTLCRFPRRRLEALFDQLPNLQRRLFAVTTAELGEALDQMLLLGRKTAREKICSFLLRRSERAGRHGGPGNPVAMPMSRADIADYLGLTTETVSRTFTQLKTAGVIALLDGNRVLIADPGALAAIAGRCDAGMKFSTAPHTTD